MLCSSSYTWTDLTQGHYQFNVVAFTSKGSGEAASLMISILLNNGVLKIIAIYVHKRSMLINALVIFCNVVIATDY